MDPQVGQLISNKYRLVRLIGDGGMGSVFEARHELLGTTVALKFLHSQLARRKGLVERFLQEARVSARIKSPHVVKVSDVDRTPEGLAYMVMEYVEGDTLQTLYEKNYRKGVRVSYSEAFDVFLQMIDGVGAAHALGIVHRDLKPDNVILSKDAKGKLLVKILDFGIAKLKASGEVDRGLTRPGVVMGTPEYMAPEQAFSADRVDARADIFSLGVMFFEMLAGRRPVGGDNAHAIAAQYLEGRIARLNDLAPAIDIELADAVHKAMSAKPDERYANVETFRDAVDEFAPGGPTPRSQKMDVALAETTANEGELAAAVAGVAQAKGGVAKTLPPEETFTPEPASDDSNPPAATDEDAMAAAARTADDDETDGKGRDEPSSDAGVRAGTDQIPQVEMAALRAGTEAMEPQWTPPHAGTEPTRSDAVLAASGTQVGDAPLARDFAPSPIPPVPHNPVVSPATPMGTTAVAPTRSRKRGPSLLSILTLATIVSGLVVGGVYFAHRAQQEEDPGDPLPFDQPTPTQVAEQPPPDSPPDAPPDSPPDAPPEPPPPVAQPTPQPQPGPQPQPRPGPQPQPQPTAQPTSQPTDPIILPTALPTVLPSSFPPLFQIPGRTQPQPQPQPQTQPQPQPQPQTPVPRRRFPRILIPRPQPSPAQGDVGQAPKADSPASGASVEPTAPTPTISTPLGRMRRIPKAG
jgi:serine/threonine-protein kinase